MSGKAMLRRLRSEDGMGIIEAMAAAMILLVGILSTFAVLDGSRNLVTVSERKEVAVHQGELALEEMAARPFADIEIEPPLPATAGDANDPRANVLAGPPASYRSDPANPLEPLVTEPVAAGGAPASRTTWNDQRISGTVDTFVTAVGGTTDLKRVTVAVRLNGNQGPIRPIYLSTLVSEQAGGATP